MADVHPDTLIDGRYKVVNRIGSGGMADVFCAQDEQLGRKVALKLLHRRFAADEEFVERFRREAQSAAGLQHQNVVGVYDRGQWDGTYYIAMEFLPGRTLKDVIRAEAPVDPLRAIEITKQILRAARFAHRHGVIHRDLKPHNVMVDDEDRVKVTDFGIARAGASDMTETGSILGTAQYLSPEQAQGHAVSAQADLYSVGVILYELLTGRVPFDSETAVSIALKHVSEPVTPPRVLNPQIPEALESVVLWALEKDPAARPPDADAFIAALDDARRAIATGSTPGPRTASFVPVPSPAVVEEERPSAEHTPPPWEPPPEEEDRDRRRWPWLVAALVILLLAGGGVAAYLLTRPDKVPVPDVVGKNLEVAQTVLQNEGFSVNVIRRTSNVKADQVIKQDPLPQTRLSKNDTVTLTVSSGPGQGVIPDVEGKSRAAAVAALKKAGFKARVQHEHSDSVSAGKVVETKPGVGEQLEKGHTVIVLVSSGPAPVAVPDVVGEDRASARADLENAGFSVSETTQESSSKAGTVIAQSPSGRTTVAPGSTVTITVATSSQVAVPDVTGKSSNAAVNALGNAGFKPNIKSKTVHDLKQDGIVLSQSPGGGTRLDKGSTVTLTVGAFKANPNPNEQTTTTGTTDTTPTDTTTTGTP